MPITFGMNRSKIHIAGRGLLCLALFPVIVHLHRLKYKSETLHLTLQSHVYRTTIYNRFKNEKTSMHVAECCDVT